MNVPVLVAAILAAFGLSVGVVLSFRQRIEAWALRRYRNRSDGR